MHRSPAELEAQRAWIARSPADRGRLELIVRRPGVDEREVLTEARLDPSEGIVGDTWRLRGSRSRPDGSADPDGQVALMNARVAAAVAGTPDRWALAGDQLYVDLDLSEANLPPGTRLAVGDAVVEITAKPHTGCAKFAARFGPDALRFVNTGTGRAARYRGVFARVVVGGTCRTGDPVVRLDAAS